jgi:hypothetical protein
MVSANEPDEIKEPEGVQYSSRNTNIKYEDDHFNDGIGENDSPTDTNLQIKTFYYSARALERIELRLSSMGKLHDLVNLIEAHNNESAENVEQLNRERYDYTSTLTLEVEDAKQLVEDLQNAIIVAETATAEYRAYQSAKFKQDYPEIEADND